MKTYEEFLVFLDEHLKSMTDFIPSTDPNFHPICFAIGRFLLAEPYRWEKLLDTWPHTPQIPQPEEIELTDFFQRHQGLKSSFRKELKANDRDALRKGYDILYPILVTKDDFLTSIFRDDIKSKRFKKICKENDTKIAMIKDFVTRMKVNTAFMELMRKFTRDLSGFSLTLINNKNLLDQAIKKIEGKV